MDLLTLDFESYWDAEHTLKKMTCIEYVMHPKTQIQSCAIKLNDTETFVVWGEDRIREALLDCKIDKRAVVAHNMSEFDALILAWRLKVKPRLYLCTLAMARPVYGKVCNLSLAALVKHLGIGEKDQSALIDTRGRVMEDFTPDEVRRMTVYNKADTDQCYALFKHLRPFFSPEELWHLDCNVRMLVEPQFVLDTGLLHTALSVERSNKHRDLLELAKLLNQQGPHPLIQGEGWSNHQLIADRMRTEMSSAAKFSKVLESRDVDVPMKRSKTDPRKKIPAIAKTDEAMEELLDHDDPVVAAAARARLSTKSTQLETRIETLLKTEKILKVLPVPIKYCGADTTGRDSGFLYNMLNFPRIGKKPKVSDALRRSVRAPKGKVIGVCDSSGIELRINHTLWKVKRSMALWQNKADADLYRATAARYFGIPEDQVEAFQRQFAKVLELACGFGTGAKTFRQTARVLSGGEIRLTLPQSKEGVDGWRRLYPEIADWEEGGWTQCQAALPNIAAGRERAIDPWGLVHTAKDMIVGPTGRPIRYPDLRQEVVTRYEDVDGQLIEKKQETWMYAHGRHLAWLYGGKVDENIVQFLAREFLFGCALEFFKRTGCRPVHKVYDELVYLWEPSAAPALLQELHAVMRTPPKWWPELVLWSEGDIAESYGDAK